MRSILNKENLEKIFLKTWTEFIDYKNLLAFVLTSVRDANLQVTDQHYTNKKNNVQLTLSRCSYEDQGIILWVDFIIPKNQFVSIGTCEMVLGEDTKLIRVVGSTMKN